LNDSPNYKARIRHDATLFFLVVLTAGITFLVVRFGKTMNFTDTVIVRIDGEMRYQFSQPGVWEIRNSQRQYITTLHYDGNQIWVTDSNCPDRICEKTGRVKQGGNIICVPNKMIIEFKKKDRTESSDTTDVQTW